MPAYLLRPQVFSRWRKEFLERASEIFATQPSRGDEMGDEQVDTFKKLENPAHGWGLGFFPVESRKVVP